MTDTNKVTHINTRRYWTITHNGNVLFTGTFLECWDELVAQCGHLTLSSIDQAGIQITRK